MLCWMIYPGAVLTSCHGKIGVLYIGMNKLMIYFWQVYLADIWGRGPGLVAGATQKHLSSAIFPSQMPISSNVSTLPPWIPQRWLRFGSVASLHTLSRWGEQGMGWKLHQLHILESTLGSLPVESPMKWCRTAPRQPGWLRISLTP